MLRVSFFFHILQYMKFIYPEEGLIYVQEELAVNLVAGEPVQGPITPNYPFGPSREIAGDYVKK